MLRPCRMHATQSALKINHTASRPCCTLIPIRSAILNEAHKMRDNEDDDVLLMMRGKQFNSNNNQSWTISPERSHWCRIYIQ